MTRHEALLARILCRELGDTVPVRVVGRLFEMGVVDLRACERLAVRREVLRLGRAGMGRCDAMHAVAGQLSCSCEKVRTLFYETTKS